jgi:hypothetical protein
VLVKKAAIYIAALFVVAFVVTMVAGKKRLNMGVTFASAAMLVIVLILYEVLGAAAAALVAAGLALLLLPWAARAMEESG